jgi:two-component system, OmpR family, response regulator RegX3
VTGRILIAEDEPAISDAVAYALRSEGYDVEAVPDGESALEATRSSGYDLLVLDLMLPDVSGLEVCRRLRVESAVPILMLTARTAEVDRVLGLEAGADDYVVKPFSMPELVSRVRAILRRRELDRGDTPRLIAANIELDLRRHTVEVDGESVRLTPSELRLLSFFMREPGRVFSRRELMQLLWESTYVGDQRACDAHIVNLRRKIERDPERPMRLLTVRGVGYKLAEV